MRSEIMKTIAILSYLAIIGQIILSVGHPLYALSLWSITNPLLAYHHYKLKEEYQMRMFIAFFVFSVYGVYNYAI